MKRIERRFRQDGTAMVEFALGIGLLWLLFSGIYQFGYSFFLYNKLEASVANAAMFAAQYPYDTANTSKFTDAVRNMVLYSDITSGGKTLVPGLASSNVNIDVNPSGGFPTDITITITNYQMNSIFAKYLLTNKPRVTTLYMGQIICSTC